MVCRNIPLEQEDSYLMKTEQQILNEFQACEGDTERWAYLLANKDEENMPCLMLDNDDTFMPFDTDLDNDGSSYVQFAMYIGWSDGVQELLTAIGIKHSAV